MDNKIDKNNVEDIIALTPTQKAILYHSLSDQAKKKYFEQLSISLEGAVDFGLFTKAWKILTIQNEMLRAVYVWKKTEEPLQIILKVQTLPINYQDLSDVEDNHLKIEMLKRLKEEDKKKGFDLAAGPLFRVTLCRLGETVYELILSNHHIIYDGWSTGIILKEFSEIYEKLADNEIYVPSGKVRFKEYIKSLKSLNTDEAVRFWSDYFKGVCGKTPLPLDQTKEGGKCKHQMFCHELSDSLKNRIELFAAKKRISFSVMMYAVWGLILQRYSNQEDVVFGITLSGRELCLNMEETVGLFIQTLPIRITAGADDTIESFLYQVRDSLQNIQTYGYSSSEVMQSSSHLKDTLFDSLVVVENYPLHKKLFSENARFQYKDFNIDSINNFELSLVISNLDHVRLEFQYNEELFNKEKISSISAHFEQLLTEITKGTKQRICATEMITAKEKQDILACGRGPERKWQYRTLHKVFEEQAGLIPDQCALIFNQIKMTYGDLNCRANQLARKIIEKGAGPEDIIGIISERSFEMIIAILAVLKSGGAYLPLDPAFPEERIQFILEDSQAKMLLVQERFCDKVQSGREIMNLEDRTLYSGDGSNPGIPSKPESLACVIYTSGSTGNPKGVLVEHRSYYNILEWQKELLHLDKNDIILQKTAYTFDVSIIEIFSFYFAQAALCILPPGKEKDPEAIIGAIEEHHVSIINFVPSMFRVFMYYCEERSVKERIRSLKHIILGGEAIKGSDVKNFQRYMNAGNSIGLHNIYGPTEASVFVTYFNCRHGETYGLVPIGFPVSNVRIYILDHYGNMQPPGVPGELCIAGDSLSRGYLNQEELTKQKFIGCPFEENRTLYRTGDLAAWSDDGSIKFIGRGDCQIKFRGYRIELGEIETCLSKYDLVKDAAVIVEGEEELNQYLAGYITQKSEIRIEDLKKYLKTNLPDYMIPSRYVTLDAMPLTPNGKIDRRALKDRKPEELIKTEKYVSSDSVEARLIELCSRLFKKDDVTMDMDLYELGCHSLLAIQLSARIFKEFGVELPMDKLMGDSTLRDLARFLKQNEKEPEHHGNTKGKEDVFTIKRIPDKEEQMILVEGKESVEYLPLSHAQVRLYIQYYWNRSSTAYNVNSVFKIFGDLDFSRLELGIKEIIRRHETLRTTFDMVDDVPMQIIHKEVEFKLFFEEEPEKDIKDIAVDFVRPFALNAAPLLRVKAVHCFTGNYILFDMHHIITDGASIFNIIEELNSFYMGKELPHLPVRYRDFIAWHHTFLQSEEGRMQEEYWKNIFKDGYPVLKLPTDFERPEIKNDSGATFSFNFSKDIMGSLKQITVHYKVTNLMFFLSIYTILLAKLTKQEDLVIGVPVLGRKQKELEPLIGLFVNTLPLRLRPEKEQRFPEFLNKVKTCVLDGISNQYYPLDELYSKLQIKRDFSRSGLFDVIFSYEDEHDIYLSGTEIRQKNFIDDTAKFDLNLGVMQKENQIENITLEYNKSLFKKETIERLGQNYMEMVCRVMEDPEILISDLVS